MVKTKININKITDISEFVNICVSSPCEVTLKSDRYSINGKSIMGIYSLDLTKDIDVEIECKDNPELETKLYQDLRKFSVVK